MAKEIFSVASKYPENIAPAEYNAKRICADNFSECSSLIISDIFFSRNLLFILAHALKKSTI